MIFSNLNQYISNIILSKIWWNQTDFYYSSYHYLKSQSLALIIYKIVDQQGVIKLIELILISLTLGIFDIWYVNIKSGEYQQNPSFTFWSMKNFANRVSNRIIFCYIIMLILGIRIAFRKTSIVQKLVNRSIWYLKFKIMSSWNITYWKNKRFQI